MREVPVRVTARLASGVGATSAWGPGLDGIVASQLWATEKHRQFAAGEEPVGLDPEREPGDLDLPFARISYPGGWYWAATCGWPVDPDPVPEVRYWSGRVDQAELAVVAQSPPSTISDAKGRMRSRMMPLPVLMCAQMVWHAVADPHRLRRILADVYAIGKKRGSGEGEVIAWIVEEVDIDVAAASHLHPDGTLGRPTPVEAFEDSVPPVPHGPLSVYGVRPPVMHPARHTRVWLPAT